LYQADALDACAVLHAHTARRILKALADAETTGVLLAPELRRVRGELAPVLSRHPAVTEGNAQVVTWELYEAFLKVLKFAQARGTDAGEEYHGFISYRREGGSDAAMAIRASLQTRGLNTFVDVEGLDSGAYGPRLMRAIERTPAFLVLLTPGALDRCADPDDWLRKEVAHAVRAGPRGSPILRDGFR